ncbi:conserved exported hypothetical protein [Candidatus Sulfopaludibacter sp. SbA4]|nr:conserved exported hypothetical protein [Candidatus Sulfopaludibacter sp. SbA4]
MRINRAIFCILLPALAQAQFTQQGGKLVGSGAAAPPAGCVSSIAGNAYGMGQGVDAKVSADGNTFVTVSDYDLPEGAAWIFTRSNGVWSQQGAKLQGTGAVGDPGGAIAASGNVAISGDGNTVILGGGNDNINDSTPGNAGAVWIFTRSNGVWSQQGGRVVPSDASTYAHFGFAAALSADGNTAVIGGITDGGPGLGPNGTTLPLVGATWVFTRTNGVWTQQGAKLAGSGAMLGASFGAGQGAAVAVSADGNTLIEGGPLDANHAGAAWIFTRTNGVWSQQGAKLVGTGAVGSPSAGDRVAISGDGNTAVVSGAGDNNNTGALWVFTRTNGVWSQQGGKLVRSGETVPPSLGEGPTLGISRDGNTIAVGAVFDNNLAGGVWIFTRSNGVWSQQPGKLVGAGAVGPALQGAVGLSADASTLVVGGAGDNGCIGAAWVFTQPSPVPAPTSVTAVSGGGTTQTFTFSFADTGGYQNLTVVDMLIRDVLDGRQACYVAFTPAGPNSGSVLLVDDGGDAGGPYSGMVLPGGGSVSNSQCSIAGAGSLVAGSGNSLTLTLPITFSAGFAGNKVVYLSAQDTGANSGWSPLGTVSVAGSPVTGPSVTGVTPGRSRLHGGRHLHVHRHQRVPGYCSSGRADQRLDRREACMLPGAGADQRQLGFGAAGGRRRRCRRSVFGDGDTGQRECVEQSVQHHGRGEPGERRRQQPECDAAHRVHPGVLRQPGGVPGGP